MTVAPTPAGADEVAAYPAAVEDPAWRRLSPRMLAVHPLREALRLIPALFAIVAFGQSGHRQVYSLIALGVVVLLGLLRWFTTTYRVTPHHVQVRRGVLRRQVVSVPRDRVRSVDLTSHALHRVLGLSRIVIGTGQSDLKGHDGLTLDALSMATASRLRAELLHRRPASAATSRAPTPAPEMVETALATLRPGWVWYGPFTLSGIVTVGVVAGFLWRTTSEAHLDPSQFGPLRAVINQLARAPLGVAICEVVLVCVLVVAVTSAAGYVFAFWNFRLTRHSGGTLHVSRGLITLRATTIEERRLHGIEISEPPLLRLVRGARCSAITTGLRVRRGAESSSSLLLPPAPRREVERVAGEVLRTDDPVTCPLTEHGPDARRRRYARTLVVPTIVVGLLLVLWWRAGWPSWSWQASLALFPCALLLGWDRYRSLGHAVADGHLVARRGSVFRHRWALSSDGIIGWTMHQSLFQRRVGLVTLVATTAAGRQGYHVQDVGLAEALSIADQTVPDLLTPFLT